MDDTPPSTTPDTPDDDAHRIPDALATLDDSTVLTMRRAAELSGYNVDYLRERARQGLLEASNASGTWLTTAGALKHHILTHVPRRPRGKRNTPPPN